MKITKKFSYFLKEMVFCKSKGTVEYVADMFVGSVPYEKKPVSTQKNKHLRR